MKISIILSSLLFLFVLCSNVSAANPAPYTKSAGDKLNKATKSIKTPVPSVGATPTEKAKLTLNYMRQIYKKAGYNFDDSVIQFFEDSKKQPGFANEAPYNQTSAYFTQGMIFLLLEITKKVPPDTFMSGKLLPLFNEYYAQVKENERKAKEAAIAAKQKEEQQQKEREEKEKRDRELEEAERIKNEEMAREKERVMKENSLKLIPGRYECREGAAGNTTGPLMGKLDVKLVDGEKIQCSLSYVRQRSKKKCVLVNGEATLNYSDGYIATFGDMEKGSECGIKLHFWEPATDNTNPPRRRVSVQQKGKCSSYCDYGVTFNGSYYKAE